MSSQQSIRNRFAKSFRYIVSQRLVPRKDGSGRPPVVEILKSTVRTQEYAVRGESEGKSMVEAMRDGSTEDMQDFDSEIERLIRSGVIDVDIGS
jgi:twitching motility protein PilT